MNVMLFPTESMVYEFDSFRIDAGKRLLWNGGNGPIPLTPKVFDTLFYLVKNSGKVIEKDELMSAIWPDTIVEENNLNKNISALRQILGEKPGEHRFIATVPGKGYKFVADVRTTTVEKIPETPADPLAKGRQPEKQTGFRFVFAGTAILIVAVVTGSFFLSRRNTPAPDGGSKTIAILPFKPLVAGDRDEGLEFGMADALIMRLGNNREIVVRPLSSVIGYGKLEQDAVQAGRDLGADLVLDGSVQRSGDKLHVNVRLVRVTDGTVQWTEPFNEKYTDVFDVQDSIASRVALALVARLHNEGHTNQETGYTSNPDAWNYYSQAQYHALRIEPAEIRKALGLYQQAIDVDPNYALAYAGMAEAYRTQGTASFAPRNVVFPKAMALARRALEINESLAGAHATLGWVVFSYDDDRETAEKEIGRALDLAPNNWEAHRSYAALLTGTGRQEEAIKEAKLARELAPLTLIAGSYEAATLLNGRRADESLMRLDKVLELDPNFWHAHLIKGRVLNSVGRKDEAIQEWKKTREMAPEASEPIPYLTCGFAKSGRRKEALTTLVELKSMAGTTYVPFYHFAVAYNCVGESGQALNYLEKALKDREMMWLGTDDRWDNLRNDPRFIALMNQK